MSLILTLIDNTAILVEQSIIDMDNEIFVRSIGPSNILKYSLSC